MGLSITRMHRDAILKVVRDVDAQIEYRKTPQPGERIKVKENTNTIEARLLHWGPSNAYYVPMSDQDGSVQKILHEQVERVNKERNMAFHQMTCHSQDLLRSWQLVYELLVKARAQVNVVLDKTALGPFFCIFI